MGVDLLISVGIQLGSVTAAVWVLTELIGQKTGWNKMYLSLALGPLLAIATYATGFLTSLPECLLDVRGCHYLSAGFAGLITTLLAKGFHDLVGDRLTQLISK